MDPHASLSETVDPRYLPFSPRAHAYIITLLPALAILVVVALAWNGVSPTPLDLGAFLVMYVLSITGMTVGFHRHFTHLAFKAPMWLRATLIVLGSLCGQGPVIYWVALHRRHHQKADQAGDPHSPYIKRDQPLRGASRFFHSHVGWVFDHDVPSTLMYARDLLRLPKVVQLSRLYYLWMALGIIVPGVVCGFVGGSWMAALTGALWGGPIRIIVGENAIWTITSLAHLIGRQDYRSNDQSRNIGWLSVVTFGESWHNNHHAFPTSARFGLEWWQVDFGGYTVALFERLGWITDVKHPTASHRSRQRISSPPSLDLENE